MPCSFCRGSGHNIRKCVVRWAQEQAQAHAVAEPEPEPVLVPSQEPAAEPTCLQEYFAKTPTFYSQHRILSSFLPNNMRQMTACVF